MTVILNWLLWYVIGLSLLIQTPALLEAAASGFDSPELSKERYDCITEQPWRSASSHKMLTMYADIVRRGGERMVRWMVGIAAHTVIPSLHALYPVVTSAWRCVLSDCCARDSPPLPLI